MKNKLILMSAFLAVTAFGWQSAAAQFPITISIPKIPKIRKPKVETPPKTVETTTNQPDPETTTTTTSTQSSPDDEMDFRLTFFLEEIAKAQKSVDQYNPDDHLYMVSGGGESEWLLRAVSLREREKWAKQWLKKPFEQKKFADALDALSASAAKKMPIYTPGVKNFAFRSAAEEKMMKAELENAATLEIKKIGLFHANWQISKDDYGLPNARYKQGFIWVRDTSDDHPYCHLYQVNIIQDYAGGGTYAASYANFINDTLFGCPAK